MKVMKQESLLASMPKLILVVSLIVCIGAMFGLMGWVITKPVKVETPEVKTINEIIDWKTYSNPQASFTFKYPNDYEIVEDYFYETAAGIKAKNPTVVLQKIGDSDSNNLIKINSRQFDCENGKCVEANYITIGTYSKNSEILNIFGGIAESFKKIEVDETADWKTYRNEEYGFEVKYLEEWDIIKLRNEKGFDLLAPERTYFKSNGEVYRHLYEIRVEVASVPRPCLNYSFDKLVKDPNCVGIEGYKDLYSIKEIVTNTGAIGYETVWNAGTRTWFKLKVPQPNKQNIRSVQISRVSDKEIIKIYNQILSTFKFIEKNKELDWLPVNSLYFSNLVSLDNQKVVWAENKFQENKMNSKLMLADLDGQNKKTLLEKDLDGEKYFNPIRWSNSNEEIYFSEQHGGLGGYIIFSGPSNLSKINIYTGKSECLFEESNRIGYIGNISPNEEFIAYFPRIAGNPKLAIKNMKTGKENMVDIPINEGFKNGGNARFSPDSKYLVYNIAYCDPDDEYYRTIVVNSSGESQRVIIDDSQKIYRVRGWISNDEILLRGPNNTDYIIDINGNDLRKK